jgi:hypothetical protein
MKQIASQGRMLLRKILTALSLGAVAITFQACYGTPGFEVSGEVLSSDTSERIPGIQVSVDDHFYVFSSSDGRFLLYVDELGQTIRFKDVDGPENGGEFKDKTVQSSKKNDFLTVYMDRK